SLWSSPRARRRAAHRAAVIAIKAIAAPSFGPDNSPGRRGLLSGRCRKRPILRDLFGRSGRILNCDPLVPNEVRYPARVSTPVGLWLPEAPRMPRALRLPPSKRRRHSYSHNTSETGFDQAVAERERFELSVFGERMPLLGREEGSQITKRGRF